jgi:hypothetical protein
MPDNPFWYKHNNPYNNIRSATVADSVGDTFQSRYIPQQAPSGISENLTNPLYRPMPAMEDQRYGSGVSQDTIVKIAELKELVYKYRQYQNNDPDEIVKWAVHGAINGDNKFLHDKLDLLRTIESLAKY